MVQWRLQPGKSQGTQKVAVERLGFDQGQIQRAPVNFAPRIVHFERDRLATDRTTLTRNLRPLLASGVIERAAAGDKRRHELVATLAGRALFKRALPMWAAAEQEVRDAMGAKLTADLHVALDRSMEKLAPL